MDSLYAGYIITNEWMFDCLDLWKCSLAARSEDEVKSHGN